MRMRIALATIMIVGSLAACGAAPAPTSAPAAEQPAMGGGAQIQEKIPFTEVLRDANHVVVGRVVSVKSQWNADKTAIFTTVRVSVEDTVTGSSLPEVTLTLEGGEVDGIAQSSGDGLTFTEGDQVVLFLKGESIVGGPQGVYHVESGQIDGTSLDQFLQEIRDAE